MYNSNGPTPLYCVVITKPQFHYSIPYTKEDGNYLIHPLTRKHSINNESPNQCKVYGLATKRALIKSPSAKKPNLLHHIFPNYVVFPWIFTFVSFLLVLTIPCWVIHLLLGKLSCFAMKIKIVESTTLWPSIHLCLYLNFIHHPCILPHSDMKRPP